MTPSQWSEIDALLAITFLGLSAIPFVVGAVVGVSHLLEKCKQGGA